MEDLIINKLSKGRQLLLSGLLVAAVSLLCFAFSSLMGYRVVALILLLTVSLLAITFDILPVLLAAALSALTWNFFFIPPTSGTPLRCNLRQNVSISEAFI